MEEQKETKLDKLSSEELSKHIKKLFADKTKDTLKVLWDIQGKYHSKRNWRQAYSQLEEETYLKYAEVVNKRRAYFSLEDINDVCKKFPYDILIYLSKKGIGKTWAMFREMARVIQEGKKFIFLRITEQELDGFLNAINRESDEACPVYAYKYKRVWNFYNRKTLQDLWEVDSDGENFAQFMLDANFIKKWQITPVGYAYCLKTCQKFAGGSFHDVETIFVDEVISYDDKQTLREEHKINWFAFADSVMRRKENLKIYCFGNLLAKKNLDFLRWYHIDVDDRLRYFAHNKTNEIEVKEARVLFINAMGLYSHIIKQGAAVQGSPVEQYVFEHNTAPDTTDKILDEVVFLKCFKPLYCWVYKEYLFELKTIDLNSDEDIPNLSYAIKINTYDGFNSPRGELVFSSDPKLLTKFDTSLQSGPIEICFDILLLAAECKKLRFVGQESISNFIDLYDSIDQYLHRLPS